MIRRRKSFDTLSRARMLELTGEFGIAGLMGKSNDAIAERMAGERSLRTPDLLAALSPVAYRGTVSLSFEPGDNRRVVVKIVDDRGIECLKIAEVLE